MDAPIIIAGLIVAAIWGYYLFPALAGHRRETPITSTERFDQWTHVMADVQQRTVSADRATMRDVVRARRRRTLLTLAVLTLGLLGAAIMTAKLAWLLAGLVSLAVTAWYVAMLLQVKQRQAMRVAHLHAATRPTDADQPPVRIVAGS